MIIKNGHIIDPISGLNEPRDIVIKGGIITGIIAPGITLEDDGDVIDAKGCFVSPGFIDIHSHFRDPGNGSEDIISGAIAAAKGGYTTVLLMANTNPAVDNAELLKQNNEKAKNACIKLFQLAAITKGLLGKELTDFSALIEAGAIGLTDDGKNMEDETLAEKAMQLAAKYNTILSFHEEASKYIGTAGVNNSAVSKKLGLNGADRLAEECMIERDIALSLKTGAHIHFQHISSKGSVELIKAGKEAGANITAEATPHHFSLTQDAVLEYGTNAKINPPLREEADRLAIIEGIRNGVIDIIATDHAPHKTEDKLKPFKDAPSGIIGLETAFSLCIESLYKKSDIPLYDIIAALTKNPASLYGLTKGIKIGLPADIVIYDINKTTTYDSFVSKSSNSPFTGQTLSGKILYTIYHGQIVYFAK